ncbi:hypothetical protein GYMLUDRAFT_64002 [Collybiopsis luxurians FD-317 M1]|uniref:Uncharacterized protein n=1 Tax=Collybiopsis luxurians FD-317 M1 TaxID=944289 RepID=A0A0D0CD38_9AGAR|nr:hypothetical protein GYMLUDRAFT_64002 [Collybiopsis luxurians FD-317 M1]
MLAPTQDVDQLLTVIEKHIAQELIKELTRQLGERGLSQSSSSEKIAAGPDDVKLDEKMRETRDEVVSLVCNQATSIQKLEEELARSKEQVLSLTDELKESQNSF